MQLKTFTEFSMITEAQNSLRLNVPQDIIDLYNLFQKNGKELYIVGGAVRDALMGKKPKDFDLATDAFPEEVVKIVQGAGYSTIGEVGQQFGVVIVQIPSDKNGVEIATFREDIGKGRRPEGVNYSTIDKDVLRRDLTINALFYDIGRQEVVDLVGGIKDIQDQKIRTVGVAADRFAEDPLRKLRALRFAGRTGSKLEKGTADAILTDNSLEGVSPERVRDEFKKSIESAKKPIDYLKMVSEFNLWSVMFPNIPVSVKFVNTNTWPIQLTHLFGDNDVELIKREMNRATFSGDEVSSVIFLKSLRDFKAEDVFDIYKQFTTTKIDKNAIIEFAKINRLDLKLIKAFLKYKPSTDGKEVMQKYGIKGPQVGEKIKELEAEKFKQTI
jgi:tRNA nucleotidyltransferase/poly(A) polymerase